MAQLDARPTGDRRLRDPRQFGNIFLWRFDHEIFSMVILWKKNNKKNITDLSSAE